MSGVNYTSCCLFFFRALLVVVFLSASAAFAEDTFIDDTENDPFEGPTAESIDTFDQFDEFDEDGADELYDPLGSYNRLMTQFNDKFYVWVLKPSVKGYRFIMRKPSRQAIDRFFKNLGFPIRLVNNLLQLKVNYAGIETIRLCVNSTTGVLGFFDPAREWLEMDAYPEDFGQTLGHYGLGGGFHIVLPFLGPSNLRDVCGKVPDYFLDPVFYIEDMRIAAGLSFFDFVNRASLHIEQYDALRKDALDLYPFLRNAYEQNRKKQIEE